MSALFRRQPKLHGCFFCEESILDEHAEKLAHYETHLIEVTDNDGLRAFTFECPRCGLMDLAWGGGRPNPEATAVNAIYVHLLQRHGIDNIS